MQIGSLVKITKGSIRFFGNAIRLFRWKDGGYAIATAKKILMTFGGK